jgi:hypothetical protein
VDGFLTTCLMYSYRRAILKTKYSGAQGASLA